jgi:hypothetical protein
MVKTPDGHAVSLVWFLFGVKALASALTPNQKQTKSEEVTPGGVISAAEQVMK